MATAEINEPIYPEVAYEEYYVTVPGEGSKLVMAHTTLLRKQHPNGIWYLIPLDSKLMVDAKTIRRAREEVKIRTLQELHVMAYGQTIAVTDFDPELHVNGVPVYTMDDNQEPEVDRIIKLLEL